MLNTSASGARPFFHQPFQTDAGRLQCRDETEENSRHNRKNNGKSQNRPVDLDRIAIWKKERGGERKERSFEEEGQQHTESAARERQKKVLRQQLPGNAPRTGAYRLANGNFPLPPGAPCEQQHLNVCAGDEKEEPYADEKHYH